MTSKSSHAIPFDTLRKVLLPELIERRGPQRQLNIWFAASSSGQKPYSLAMLLEEDFPELSSWRINLLGTDISQEMLQRSRTARYYQLEVDRGLPTALLQKWFRKEGAYWQLDPWSAFFHHTGSIESHLQKYLVTIT